MIEIFDRAQIARQRSRAAPVINAHDFLHRWALSQLTLRLEDVQRHFPLALQIGTRSKLGGDALSMADSIITCDAAPALRPDIVCEEDFFPFADSSFDLILSALDLHTVNDLPGALLQMRRALRPDGLFTVALLGGETLVELRNCLLEAEEEVLGGFSPRVAPFADARDIGALMQRAGFALPVVDSERVRVTYDSMFSLMKELRFMGESNAVAARRKTFTPRRVFLRAAEIYAEKYSENDGRIYATFEIVFALGWSPHDSQQKPLKPGTAAARLADILHTEEFGTGEKPH